MAAMSTRSASRAAALSLLLLLSACFSFRVVVPDEPQEVIGVLAIVCAPPSSLDLDQPVADEPVPPDAAAVHSLVKVLQVSRPVVLQWHWYSPDNVRVRSSKTVEVNARAKYLAYFAAWDTLPREQFADRKGNWTVVITAGGRFLAYKEFTVN
jgi:hypothetical protein